MSFTNLQIFIRQLMITVLSYYLLSIVVQDTFEAESTKYNWSAAVTCLLYAALQTANEPSGSINRSPNGRHQSSLRHPLMYSILRARSQFGFTMWRLRKLLKCLRPLTYVRRQRVTFTQCRSVGRLGMCTSIGGWLSTGVDKGDRTGILPDVTIWRLTGDVMMENARGKSLSLSVCNILFLSPPLKCHRKNRSSISIFFTILCTMHRFDNFINVFFLSLS